MTDVGRITKQLAALLRPLGVYRLEPGTLVWCELNSYAAGIALVAGALEETERELCIKTAQGYGLEMWEAAVFGSAFPDLPAENRRRMLMAALSVQPDGWSLGALERALEGVGITASIREHPADERLSVAVESYHGRAADYSAILERLQRFLPAHLEFSLEMGEFSWEDFDEREYPWDQWDQLDLDWERWETGGH